jgi:Mg/Co/Ni transporter MgtE
MTRNSCRGSRNRIRDLGVYLGMKRDTSHLVAATLRTGFLVGFALLLILVLFPAAMAQASGPR